MYPVTAFVREVESIAAKKPRYQTGGTGKNGICDCIGLDMGAMYALGHEKYDLHSTNYFARFQTLELKRINREKDLFVGQVLYRARKDDGRLADRYKPGGAHYTGDPLDYYHVLTVTSVNPLRIVECTQYDGVDGIQISTKLSGAYYGGKLRGVNYDEQEEETEMGALYQARVITKETPLTLRNAPVSGKKIGELPKGAIVDVYSTGEWPRVRYEDMMGYASAEYLERIEEADTPTEGEAALPENVIRIPGDVRIIDDAGRVFRPVGNWRTVFGEVD